MHDLFLYRSAQNLHAAELLFDAALYDPSANRAYYAAFGCSICSVPALWHTRCA